MSKGIKFDNVNKPAHYQGKVECIDAIEASMTKEEFKGYCKGNSMKYIYRAGKKGDLKEDIEKAIWYLKRMTKEDSPKVLKNRFINMAK